MILKNTPIRRKLMAVILLISGAVLLLTCAAFVAYEYFTFRKHMINQVSTLGEIIADNSTAALAFDSQDDANQILAALDAEPHIVAAGLYDEEGHLFAHYPDRLPLQSLPAASVRKEFFFENGYLHGFLPVMQSNKKLGSLYLRSNMDAVYARFKLYGQIAALVVAVCILLAYFLSRVLQKGISDPILSLAETAQAVSSKQDYSLRAPKFGEDEIGFLTDDFNQMLERIQRQNQEIVSFNQKLEQKVEERTMQLAEANKELESFSYSVSHDLRAPLRAVNGYAKILEEDFGTVLDDEGRRLLTVVQENAKRMGLLIDDLLSFSRLGRKDIMKSYVDMDGLVKSVKDDIEKSTPHRARVIIHPLNPLVADRSLINQVMVNLLSNAIKYSSGAESPVVEIKSYKEDGEVVYEVKDNGAGFNNLYVDKLFGVFQRLHSNEEFEGTGVGLALVKRIITKHGGRVWANGEVNKGATFYFSLPEN